jgi:NitT/TauT family transport system substrate-binding protein
MWHSQSYQHFKLHLVAKIVLTCKIEIPILNPVKSKFLSDQTELVHEMTMINTTQRNHKIWRELRWISVFFLLLLFCAIASPASAAETALKKASLMPLWSPQAQFAGYYVALDKGIFARHGINLKILKAGPGHSPAQALKDGTADFAVLWLTTALQQRSAGIKLVNLAQIIQRSSIMLISKKSSGISTIADMNGKKVGMWGGDLSIPPHALFNKHGIKVREVPQTHTVNLFLRGGIDVTSAMWYNEYHTILNSGVDPEELNIFSLNEQGMNFPEDGIYTLEKTLHKDPSLAKAFVTASLEGWRYAFAHPDEALDIVIKHMREAQVPANRIHQKWMLDRMRDLIMPGTIQGTLGILKEQDYEAVGRAMCKDGLIRSYPDYTAFSWRSDAGEK